MTLSEIPLVVTGEHIVVKHTDADERPTRAEIARLAYELYETSGRRDGRDLDDWLSAERALMHHYR